MTHSYLCQIFLHMYSYIHTHTHTAPSALHIHTQHGVRTHTQHRVRTHTQHGVPTHTLLHTHTHSTDTDCICCCTRVEKTRIHFSDSTCNAQCVGVCGCVWVCVGVRHDLFTCLSYTHSTERMRCCNRVQSTTTPSSLFKFNAMCGAPLMPKFC